MMFLWRFFPIIPVIVFPVGLHANPALDYGLVFNTGEMVAGEAVSFHSEWETITTAEFHLTSYRFYVAKTKEPNRWLSSFEGEGDVNLSKSSSTKGLWTLDETFDLYRFMEGDAYDIHFEVNGYRVVGLRRVTISFNWTQTNNIVGTPYGRDRVISNGGVFPDHRHHWEVTDDIVTRTTKVGDYTKRFVFEYPENTQVLPPFFLRLQLYKGEGSSTEYAEPPRFDGTYYARNRRANFSAGTEVGDKDLSFVIRTLEGEVDGEPAGFFVLRNHVFMDKATAHCFETLSQSHHPSRLAEVDFLTMPVGEEGCTGTYVTDLAFDYDGDHYTGSWRTENTGSPLAGNETCPYVIVVGDE